MTGSAADLPASVPSGSTELIAEAIIGPVARVLLLLPSATYRAADFLEAARALDVDVVVASEQRQTLAEAMGDRALHLDLHDRNAATEAPVALAGRGPIRALLAVDDRAVGGAAEEGGR